MAYAKMYENSHAQLRRLTIALTLLTVLFAPSCRTTKRTAQSSSDTTVTAQRTVQRMENASVSTTVHTETVTTGEERTVTTTTTRTTVLSEPDSLGQQHPLSVTESASVSTTERVNGTVKQETECEEQETRSETKETENEQQQSHHEMQATETKKANAWWMYAGFAVMLIIGITLYIKL